MNVTLPPATASTMCSLLAFPTRICERNPSLQLLLCCAKLTRARPSRSPPRVLVLSPRPVNKVTRPGGKSLAGATPEW